MCGRATTCITCGPARPHISPFTCILNLGYGLADPTLQAGTAYAYACLRPATFADVLPQGSRL
ncbi:hypothetical protein JG688_00007010 [Phytophthora aleatoria]|uniref:Uncharacterized protein n=1 Tax=Phytophthora aleatoria TaxID=2496075 RepID=A0A8J5JAA9_9STRA|nr:hypothetical protein JG688_00007010 [Phytophthora aleatoria]